MLKNSNEKFLKINNYSFSGNTIYLNKNAISHYIRSDTNTQKCFKIHLKAGLFGNYNNLPVVYTLCDSDNKESFDILNK